MISLQIAIDRIKSCVISKRNKDAVLDIPTSSNDKRMNARYNFSNSSKTELEHMRFTIMAFLLFVSSKAIASGSVFCQASGSSKFEISWSVTHGIGSPRFGPYLVMIRDKSYRLWPYGTKKHDAPAKGIRDINSNEVGYWIAGKRVQVRLTDDQLLWTQILLDIYEKGKDLVGEAVVQLEEKGAANKFPLICSIE